MKFPLNKIVEVHWNDANGYSKWSSLKDYLNHTTAPCKTVGYLLRKSKHEIVLAFTQSSANDGDINGAMAIPMGFITKIRRLKS